MSSQIVGHLKKFFFVSFTLLNNVFLFYSFKRFICSVGQLFWCHYALCRVLSMKQTIQIEKRQIVYRELVYPKQSEKKNNIKNKNFQKVFLWIMQSIESADTPYSNPVWGKSQARLTGYAERNCVVIGVRLRDQFDFSKVNSKTDKPGHPEHQDHQVAPVTLGLLDYPHVETLFPCSGSWYRTVRGGRAL